MSKLVQDVKSGLKGIKGAGDAVRGGAMEATDELFDRGGNHPQTAASQAKNRALAEKGTQEAKLADRDIGSRHGPAAKNASIAPAGTAHGQTVTDRAGVDQGTAAPVPTGREEYV